MTAITEALQKHMAAIKEQPDDEATASMQKTANELLMHAASCLVVASGGADQNLNYLLGTAHEYLDRYAARGMADARAEYARLKRQNKAN